jgi:hypothetical protein
VGAGGLHDPGLTHEVLGRRHVGHHQERRDVKAQVSGGLDVLVGDVGLGAVRGDAHRVDAAVARALQVVDGADARQQQRRELAVGEHSLDRPQVLFFRVTGEPVGERVSVQAVAVGDLDEIDARLVQLLRDRDHLLDGVLVRQRVHAVAQRRVVQEQLLRSGRRRGRHGAAIAGRGSTVTRPPSPEMTTAAATRAAGGSSA